MYIVQAASEFAPVAKVGGLADVMMGLSRELVHQGHSVDICIPKYDCLDMAPLRVEANPRSFVSFFEGAWHENRLVKALFNHDFHLSCIECHHPRRFFDRGEIYGQPDDIDRFLYFSRAVLDWLKSENKVPDIIHVHDWETAAIAVLIKDKEFRDYFKNTRVVFTIHNLEYQGWCSVDNIAKVGLVPALYDTEERLHANGCLNLMKGGILFSDYVTTVSPNYAKEVLTPEGGRGLEKVLKKIPNFSGILNGIDTQYWDPAKDPYLPHVYSAKNPAGKLKSKHDLQALLGMKKENDRPLIATIARLVPQKGLPLIEHAIKEARGRYQFVLLGTTHDPAVEAEFQRVKKEVEAAGDVRIILKTEESLAHKIYAAADVFLVPSLFEPCGLVQLIALRYGAIPVVRATGGLADTIRDGDNGFVFRDPDTGAIDWVLGRVLDLWKQDRTKWHDFLVHCMECDFSWKGPAAEYVNIYNKVLSR